MAGAQPADPNQGKRQGLTAATLHGLKWSYTSTFVNAILQIGVTAVLARLLTPSAFGVVAMASVFLRFGQCFAQMGAGQAIVQRAELTKRDVHSAFTSSLIIGAVFGGLFAALAPLAALLFPDTRGVVTVTRVLALTFVLGGPMAVTQALLRRRFAFRAIALTEIVSFVLGYALVGLLLAVLGFGAWSLVAASLVQSALAAVAYLVLCRKDIGFGLAGDSLRSIYSFGGRVSLIGFGEFIGSNLDTLWVGHFLGVRVTGLYSRATNLANLPLYYLTTSLSRVLMPAYSRIQNERARLKTVYVSTITVAAALAMPVSWGAAAAAHEVVGTLLGRQWGGAVPVLGVLALAVPFSLLTHFGAILCEATATLNTKIAITLGRIVCLTALLSTMTRYGVVGIAASLAISELATHLAYQIVMCKLLALRARELLGAYAVGVAAGVMMALALFGIHAGLDAIAWPTWLVLLVQAVLGGALLLVAVTKLGGGRVWREIRRRLADAGYGRGYEGPGAWLMRRAGSVEGVDY